MTEMQLIDSCVQRQAADQEREARYERAQVGYFQPGDRVEEGIYV